MTHRLFLRLLLCAVFNGLCVSSALSADFRDSVVKIFVTSNQVDFTKPWQSTGSHSSSGSGCVIEGNRILTNAHVVANHTFIQVRKESSPRRYTAQLKSIGYDADLAILTVDDPDFFSDVTPVAFGDLPDLRDTVTVIGFPLGGDKLSITEGVVSRIEVIPYAQSAQRLLGVQIDAAINPGNSGGPVIMNGKLVGIVMQLMSSSQNIGYMIPMPIITHFLKDCEDGDYKGFPSLGIEYQLTENDALRNFYRLEENEGGVLITQVIPFFPADGLLQRDDVLLAVDGVAIAEDGTYEFRRNERLAFSYLINQKQIGETVNLMILRNGKRVNIPLNLVSMKYLIPPPNNIAQPPYYIYGGLVFTVLSMDLLTSWGDRWWERAPFNFLYFLGGKGRLNEDRFQEVVVLLDILPDDRNIGYSDSSLQTIVSVNGRIFSSFKEFVQLVETSQDAHVVFLTDEGSKIIILRKDIDEITEKIIKRNNISNRFSNDVKLWF